MADALHDSATIDDDLWAQLQAGWSAEQLVEAVCVCGFYHLVSFVCGTFRVEHEPWAVAPPAAAR